MPTDQPFVSSVTWSDAINNSGFWSSLAQTVLPPYVNTCRWFAGKARPQTGFAIQTVHVVPLSDGDVAYLLILEASYANGLPEQYLLPLSFVSDRASRTLPFRLADVPEKGRIGDATLGGRVGTLIDAIYDERFRQALFGGIQQNQTIAQANGQLTFHRGNGLDNDDRLHSQVLPVDSSNSAMTFGDKYFLKLYRKLFSETNPEVDMVAFLTDESSFDNIPAFGGSIVWKQGSTDVTLGMMQRMVSNDRDSWAQTGDYLNDFLYAVPQRIFSIREDVFEKVELLARRTGEMHCALYKPIRDGIPSNPDFAPESFTPEYRDFLIQRFEDLLERRYTLLIDNYTKLDPQAQRLAWVFMEAREMIETFIADFRTRSIDSMRIRIHGDYHLGQVLAVKNENNEDDFIIIDFEGEPESSISERKIKHSPLKDVAGMIRSYHYAVSAKLFNSAETEELDPDHLQRVSDRWFYLIRDTFLNAYFDVFGTPHPLFRNNNETNFLLLIYLLEKAVYELGYEISYRPSWVKIPLKGIIDVIREIEKIRLSDSDGPSDVPMLQTGLLQKN
ncbi:putative maltokinase [Spirosoma utsteinense]|uniref:Maltokinase n=1 Tax=Spirosoma utsteinense TaxID=2585773 RepID=A0ABR6WB85_9BACT|nr:putative maltokinase [Spirosoma utsteinense]MBC3786800.1 maltose alpha-D-glucosyltransferase/alpha-amylase [Spirosoma utsteinense]MBC3793778.1 maltose alpha-D-glucosyltransferase/alpha-amylase [Spirosoma utsteinense]